MKKKGIFNKRVNILPYDYPSLLLYKDAIRHSYWIDTEYNFTTDINDYMVNITENEKDVIKKTMLAIAQIEVNVKTFWADMYKRMPITEIGDVGMTFAECHVEGTEILTPQGWVDFNKINIGDEVIQFNPDNTLNVTIVNNKTYENYNGIVHRIYKDNLDTIITPNHRIGYYNHKNEFSIKAIEDLGVRNANNRLPEAGKLIGDVDELSTLDRLKIAIQADGSKRFFTNKLGERIDRGLSKDSNTYEISVKKNRKKERLLYLLNNTDIKYRTYKEKRGYLKVEFEMDMSFNYKTFDWVNLKDKSWKWCKEFVQELSEWDGYKLPLKKDCKIKYTTTNKSCADIAQAIGTCAGYKVNFITSVDKRSDNFNDNYVLSFLENRERVGFSALKEEKLNYDGKIYCVSVDSGMIITRYNNKTFIGGNSEVRHKDAYARLLRILGLEDEFRTVVEIPAIKDRIKYLTKYIDGTRSDDDKMYTKSILLFSLFIEHVSLFSQFLIMMSFNKEKNLFKGISNVVEATSKEENIHGNFGAEVINIIKSEYPEWFDEEFTELITSACKKAYKAECKILDWIFEKGELEFLSKETIKNFIMNRFNNSLQKIGIDPIFNVDLKEIEKTLWFDVETTSTKEGDFFYKKQIDYNKKSKSIGEDDLF